MAGVAEILPGYVWEALVPSPSNPLIHGIDCAKPWFWYSNRRRDNSHSITLDILEVLLRLLSELPS